MLNERLIIQELNSMNESSNFNRKLVGDKAGNYLSSKALIDMLISKGMEENIARNVVKAVLDITEIYGAQVVGTKNPKFTNLSLAVDNIKGMDKSIPAQLKLRLGDELLSKCIGMTTSQSSVKTLVSADMTDKTNPVSDCVGLTLMITLI